MTMKRLPRVTPAFCPNTRGGNCELCAEACPSGALSLSPTPEIDVDACRSCGVCAATCPSGALDFFAGPNVLNAVSRLESRDHVRVSCFGVKRPDDTVLEAGSCLSALGADILVSLAALGVSHVTFVRGRCATCAKGDGAVRFQTSLSEAKKLVDHSRSKIVFDVAGGGNTVKPGGMSRRGFFGVLGAVRQTAENNLSGESALVADSLAKKRRSSRVRLHQALAELRARGGTPVELAGGQVRMSGQCTACGACARICPTGALEIELSGDGFSLLFSPWLCMGCGLCERACLSGCLRLLPGVVVESGNDEPRELASGELHACARCKAQTAQLVDHKYCMLCAKRLGLAHSS